MTMSNLDTLIQDLVIANRILAKEDVVDAYGHVSVRHRENPDRFLIARSVSPELVSAEDMVDPETVAITNSRSKEAFDRPCDETRSRSRALWQDANRMAIGNHALHPVLSFRAEARRPRRL
jgi:Class II Aldolase and Adducin N-terminal domain